MLHKLFKEETTRKIEEILPLLDASLLERVIKARTHKEVLNTLGEQVRRPEMAENVWRHIIYQVWDGVKDSDERRSMTTEEENWFLRLILNKGGVISRSESEKEYFSPRRHKVAVDNLEERGIIISLQARNWKVYYILDPRFLQEVYA